MAFGYGEKTGNYPFLGSLIGNSRIQTPICEVLPTWFYFDCNLNTIDTYNGHLNKHWEDYIPVSNTFDVPNDFGFNWKERILD